LGMADVNSPLEARPKGFEPPTLGSEDRCSCPLSYGRIFVLVAVWSGGILIEAGVRVSGGI
jgi:hypothetical protein